MMEGSHKITWTCFWALCIVLLNAVIIEGATLCYQCQNMAHPRDCGRIATCRPGEECFTESIATASGNILYNLGCSSQQKCGTSSTGKRSVEMEQGMDHWRDPKLQKRADIILCYACCNNMDYCNHNQCEQAPSPISYVNRTTCFNCPNVESPDKCEFIELCDVNEVCYTELISINSEDRYRMGCVRPDACDIPPNVASPNIVGKKRFLVIPRIASYCGQCCKDGLGNCNRDMCRSGVTPRPNTQTGVLLTPPPYQDCEDVDTQYCRDQLNADPDSCLNATISHYACRRTCGCASGVINTGPDLGASLLKSDCFYESTRYQGNYRFTVTNKACISWDLVLKSNPTTDSYMFPDKPMANAENKCRDPDGKGHPWCYTSNFLEWDYCPVPYCAECAYNGVTTNYKGYISKDATNNKCLPWADYKGTTFSFQDSMFPDNSVKNASSYCRNPFMYNDQTITCLTDSGFRNCSIDTCPGVCEDDPDTDCSRIASFVCQKEFNRKTMCPKTCGDCDFGLLPPRKIAPPARLCEDADGVNCPYLKDVICQNQAAAKELCPTTCGVGCGIDTTTQRPTITTNPTNPNITYTWSSWGSFVCSVKNGLCFMVRHRNCSSGNDDDCNGLSIEINVCTNTTCPGVTVSTPPSVTSSGSSAGTTTELPTTVSTLASTVMSTTVSTLASTMMSTTVSTLASTVITTNPPDQCQDNNPFPCNSSADILALVCNQETPLFAASSCRKTCGYCDCKDVLNCSSPGAQNYFCSDNTMAVQFCKRTCKKCGETSIPIHLNNCGDPVSENSCPYLDRELCICEDSDIKPLCGNFCNGQCTLKPVRPNPDPDNCKHAHNSGKRRSEIMRRVAEFLL